MDYPILFDGDMLLERVGNSVDTAIQSITGAKNFGLIVKRLRAFDGADGPAQRAEAKRLYGLRVRGQKARERLNQQARDILARVQGDHTKLTDADRDILMQYSGRGGLQSENSLSEYYTPPEIAEGAWDALKANGFENGSVLEPSTGAGVFLGTKPSGVKMVGCEIDETSSGVAGLLNPDDVVRNQSFEQLCATTPDGTFDSVVGNVPFGDTRGKWKQYDTDYQDIKEMERYFVTRAVDKVKPGGLVCLIVPVNIVGDRSGTFQKWRRMLSLKAEFLGAHKLPSGTFGGQNGNGTDTVVDVLVLRKHSAEVAGKVIDMAAKDLEATNVQWPTWIEGEWFRSPEGKRFIHGELMPGFRGDIVKSDLTNAQIKNLLARRFESRIDFAALNAAPTITRNYADGDRRMIAGVEHELVAGEWVKVEALVTHGGLVDQSKYGVATLDEVKDAMMGGRYSLALSFEAAERAVTGEFSSMAERSLVAAIAVAREAPENMRERVYRAALIGYEIELYTVKLNSGEAKPQDLERIQELVAAEVATYGNPANDLAKMMLRADGANRVATFANSMKSDGGFNDLLAGKVDRSKGQAYDGDNFADVVRHLTAMNGKPVGLEDALALYTGAAAVKSLEDAAAFDTVAITVDGLLTTMGRYVSGNVVEKSRDLQAHIARADESPAILSKWQQQLEAISSARTVVGVDAITFSMRGKWYQSDYMEEFLREQGFGDLDWDKEKREWWNEGADGFEKQLGNYLNGRGVGGGVRTAEYKERIAQLEEQFNIWMRQHEDVDELVSLYNDVFNAHLPHQYDEADLSLEGVSDQVKPHGYQNSAIRRASEEGRGIIGLDVGLGKTFSALALAAYNRQHGRAKRTCIVVPKAVLENWYHEAKQFYGNLDSALFVGFTPVKNRDGIIERKPVLDEKGQPRKNRHTGEVEMRDVLKEDSNALVFEKMHQIPATSASLVIMTKERFGEIPMRAETREGYADKMADMRLLSDAKAKEFLLGEKTSGSYAEAKRSEKYQEMYSRTGGKKKNEFPYFEQMGFDSVIVDEAHEFKNAYEANSQTAKLAYLPTAPASKRSIDMAAKMAYLREQNGGRGPVLLTATPITNSPTEIFNMLSYVMDIEEFEKMGITSVDDFIQHYCETKVVDVVKLSGKVEAKEAVVGFRNLDGLRNLFNRFANIKKAADVNDAANSLKIPEANEVLATANMLPEQRLLYEELRLQAEGIETIDGQQYQVEEKDRRPVFAIIRDMDRVTTDLDLYNRTMTFTFAAADRAKLEKLVQDLPQSLSNTLGDAEDGDDVEREEVLLADAMSIESDGKNVTLKVPEAYEDEVVRRLSKFGITENTVAHPVTPKYAKMLENLRAEYEVGGKQIVFTEEKSQHNKIKRLIVHHLPVSASEIEIINAQTASGDKLEKISAAYNTGKAKIVIANRKAEVGVNLQRGTTAIHHLTLPWTPASIQQRNGRGVRQGNTAAKVDVFYYVGKGSFDQYRLDMLKRKADWLDSLFTGKESRAENANAGVSDEYAAMLAADPEEFKRRIEAQKAAKAANEREQRNLRAAIDLHQLAVAKRVLSKIEQRRAAALEEAKDDGERNGINARFDEMRRKNERKVRTLTDGLLSQQDGGKIDVDAKMLIETGQYAVDTNGSIIRAGGFYQYKRDGSYGDKKVILEVTSVDAEARTITGKLALGNDHPVEYALRNGKSMPINNLPRGLVEVKLNRQQMAQERMNQKPFIEYDALFHSDLRTGAEWLAVAQRERGCSGIAMVRNAAGQYALIEGDFKPMPEGLSLVYPEPESAAYRDALGPLLVPHIGENRYSTSISGQAIRLAMMVFGDDWEQEVGKYGKQADAEHIESIANEATGPMLASAQDKGDDIAAKMQVLKHAMVAAELKAKEIAGQMGFSNVAEIKAAAVAKIKAALDQAQTELQAKNDAEIAARKARIAQMQADAASNPDQTKAIEVVRRVWGVSYDSVTLTEEKAQAISQAQFMLADAVLQLIQSGNTPKEVMEKAGSVGQRLHGEMNAAAFGMTQLAIGQRATSAAALTLYPDIIHPAEITKATAAYIGSFGEHQVGRVVAMVVPDIAKELATVEPAQDAKSLTKAWEKFTSTLMASWDSKSYGSLSGFGDFSRQGPRRNAINAILATCQAGFMARFGAAAGQESAPAAAPASAAVPDTLIVAFASRGIQAKTNTAAVMWSDRNKGKQAMAEPGTRLFFFDPKGRGGPLNTMAQDWLKREYGAVWSADFATGFTGLWWHIPVAGVDFEKLERKVKQ